MKNMRAPIASVIVPTYNRSVLLDYTLQSIANQHLDTILLEVLVVDDGSTDDTLEVVNKYQDSINIRYFFQEDRGYCPGSARNVGVHHAKGQICIFIDSGVLLSSNCLIEHIMSHFTSNCPVAVLGYVYGFDQGNEQGDLLQDEINCQNPDLSIERFAKQGRFLDIREVCYKKYNNKIDNLPAPWVFFWTCNVSVKKDNLDKVGAFDSGYDLNWGVEDHDLGYRLYQDNVKIIVNKNAASIHFPHAKDEAEKCRQEMKNKIYFDNKFKSSLTELFLTSTYLDLNDKALELLEASGQLTNSLKTQL